MAAHLEDEQLAAWLDGRLAAAALRRLHAHVDGCGACRRLLVEAVRARSSPAPSPDVAALSSGHLLGRYVVLSRLGAGSFGVVYEAFDPSLDRRLALKVLPADDEARQLDEARTLARVRHANSVMVHDVGAAAGCIFIAMELLEGGTLQQWLAAGHEWRAVVRRFCEAGRGLAAAHEVGVVHRDFKPANVLLRADGAACVADYGLADSGPVMPELGLAIGTPRSRKLVGTPAYLAPELIAGGTATPASDQFGFCVALSEALSGERPFAGETLGAVLDAMRAGRVRLPANVPPRVARALARGLAAAPQARWPTMQALVAELEASLSPRRRLPVAVGAALTLALGSAALLSRTAPCEGVEAPLATVWNDEARGALAARFASIARPWSRVVASSTTAAIDAWAARWAGQRADSCRATRVRGEQSEPVLVARTACFERHLAGLSGLLSQLSAGDEVALSRAPLAVAALPPLAECADVEALLARVPPPSDPATRAESDALLADISRAGAFLSTGRFRDGVPVAEELVRRATTLAWRPAEGRALLLAGELAERTGVAEAGELLSRAVLAATAGRDDETAATALVAQLQDAAKRSDFERARRLEAEAVAAVERARAQAAPLGARLASARGILADRSGHAPEAIAFQRAALELLQTHYGETSAPVGTALNNLGAALVASHRYGEAKGVLARAIAVRASVLGEGHPDLASSLANLGSALDGLGETAESILVQRRALRALEAGLGDQHLKTLSAMANLALALMAGDAAQRAEAATLFERCASLEEQRSGAGPSQLLTTVFFGWAELLDLEGHHDRALAVSKRAHAAAVAMEGPESLDAARALDAIARAQHALGQSKDAEAAWRQAVAVEQKVLEPGDVRLAYPLSGLGGLLVAGHRAREAVPLLTRAHALLNGEDTAPMQRAEVALQLATALREAGEPARARVVAAAALDDARDAGVTSAALEGFLGAR